MPFWKQLATTCLLLLVALAGWIWLSPEAARTLVQMGAPERVVSMLSGPLNAEGSDAQPKRGAGAPGGAQGQARGAGQGAGQGGGQRRGNQSILIAAERVSMGVVNDRLSAIGDGVAMAAVTVMPQASGTISEILVDSGKRVAKGDVIARLDSEEQVILRDQAAVALRSATERAESYRNLRSFSRLEVLDAEIAEEQAQLQLTTAELNLKRRQIAAPIDGVIGIVAVNVGDNVTTSTSIVSLDDRSQLLVDFWAPERFATALRPGLPVEATSVSRPGQVFSGVIDAVDSRVDPASRTMRVRARIDNVDDMLRAGMSFGVSMRFEGDRYPSVNPLAVQWDGEGAFVWQVVEEKSVKTRVRIIQRNSDQVLVDAPLNEGDLVAVEGLQRVRENGPVNVANAEELKSTAEVAVR
ncbi:efflux RND transporter periplasmic adaptor subunit [Rhizobium sp. AAP43]|uniref:efflux RND transporter periplasmic adaptor subunit n=1 Tax=Rhizobium sp. AAP43 TaxID=1523420 RepID=UPI0006B8FE2B|nr:efflux RND transporter periplasmic adaptor subunit [Rhizobium sp. AAP43]KPF42387.1 secretion protein HylD [Rhizobium sp. AAP43]